MKNINKLYLIALLFGLFSCAQELDENPFPSTQVVEEPVMSTSGSADFSNFVAMGNSLTAGYQASALFTEGQNNSLPSIIHSQLGDFGSATFVQPTINSENGYSGMTADGTVLGRLRLQGTPPAPRPVISNAASLPSPLNPSFNYEGSTSSLNNFGVPGILLGQALIPQTGDWSLLGLDPRVSPYYARFASAPGSSTLLGDMMSAGPTFFMFWLGNNDVLGYATGGASGSVPLTSQDAFAFQYGLIMSTLTANPNVKGIVGNIPDVTSIPFFKAVPWNAIPLDESTATLSNGGYAAYNGGLQAALGAGIISQAEYDLRVINFAAGQNGFVIEDNELTDVATLTGGQIPIPQYRQTNSADLITLTAGSVLGTLADPNNPASVRGVGVALGDQYVLTTAEQEEIADAISGFNATIETQVSNYSDQVALADVNMALSTFSNTGFGVYNGVTITPNFVPPTGAFSEDGVHPNSRGYAFTANVFIEAINAKFGSDIPLVNIGKYAGVGLPINP